MSRPGDRAGVGVLLSPDTGSDPETGPARTDSPRAPLWVQPERTVVEEDAVHTQTHACTHA